MSISKEIKQVRSIVLRLLTEDARYRDSDKMLSARIWSEQLGGMQNLKNMSSYDFLAKYVDLKGGLYSQESIGRCRRKLQEEFIDLRGKKYKQKKGEQKPVKEELGYPVKTD